MGYCVGWINSHPLVIHSEYGRRGLYRDTAKQLILVLIYKGGFPVKTWNKRYSNPLSAVCY